MSLPISGGLPRLPSQATDTSNQPPAPAGNVPVIHVHLSVSSAQQESVPVDGSLSGSEPQLISRAGPVLAAQPADNAEQAFADAVLRGDVDSVHYLLDQKPDLISSSEGQPRLMFALTHLMDAKIIDRLLDTASAYARYLGPVLCQAAVEGGNPAALECLSRSRIIDRELHKSALHACLFVAFRDGPASKLDASVQAWLRYCPDRSPRLDRFLDFLEANPDTACLRSLAAIGTLDIIEHRKAIDNLLRGAIRRNDEGFASALVAWLKQSNEFSKHGYLPLGSELSTLGDDALCLLARAGLPFAEFFQDIPLFEQPGRAAEFRSTLYGCDLAASPLNALVGDGPELPVSLMKLLAVCGAIGSRRAVYPESGHKYIENALYMSGFARQIARELAPLIDSSGSVAIHLGNLRMLVFAAAVNELQASDALAACPDSEARRQWEMIVNAAQAVIVSLIGSPQALMADLLRCVTREGKIDYFRLRTLIENRGLPRTIFEQLHTLLKVCTRWAMNQPAQATEGPVTIRDLQVALHRQMLQRVFERLLAEMPASLQSREMTVRANEAELSEEERIAQHAAIEILAQYCEQLAQEPDREMPAILALVNTASGDDGDDSSSGDS